jgi:outer membrane protein
MVRRKVFGTGLILGISGLFGCAVPPPAVFDPRMLQEAERDHANEVQTAALQPLPTTREAPSYSSVPRTPRTDPTAQNSIEVEPVVRMSLREIVHRAVANNHDVRVAGYQPGIEGTRVVEAQGHFDPAYFFNTQYAHKDELTGGQVFNNFTGDLLPITSNISESDIVNIQTGLQQNLESGGQIQLQYENDYNYFFPAVSVFNPFYTSSLSLQLTQPLLKNNGYDVNQAQITISRLTQKESVLEFRKAVEQNVSDIEKAYWQLVQTEKDIHIQEQLLVQTENTYSILFTRMQKGLDVSELQVAQAQTVLESRRGQLIQFKSQARDLSDQLKALMSDPEFPISSDVLILPADAPVEEPMNFNLQDEMNTAMENRFELGEQQLKIDAATVTISVARNNLLPELDFVGSVGPQGAGQSESAAVQTNSDFQHIDYSLGIKLNIPLGNREARAIWQRTLLQRLQAMEQYQAIIEQVALDVKTSARAVDTSWQLVGSNRRSRFQAETALHSINEREKANEPLTPEFVQLKLDTQDRLSSAEQDEAEAIANYNIALAQLERAKGTLLRYNNVLLEEGTDETMNDAALLH